MAQGEIRQKPAQRATQLQPAYVGVACVEAVDEHERVQRRRHVRPEAPDDPGQHQPAVGRMDGKQPQRRGRRKPSAGSHGRAADTAVTDSPEDAQCAAHCQHRARAETVNEQAA